MSESPIRADRTRAGKVDTKTRVYMYIYLFSVGPVHVLSDAVVLSSRALHRCAAYLHCGKCMNPLPHHATTHSESPQISYLFSS